MGPHTVDRFATLANRLLPRFNSAVDEPHAEALGALAQSDQQWRRENNWVHPPFSQLEAIVGKLQRSGAAARGGVLAPAAGRDGRRRGLPRAEVRHLVPAGMAARARAARDATLAARFIPHSAASAWAARAHAPRQGAGGSARGDRPRVGAADIGGNTRKGLTLSGRTTEAVQAARLYQQKLRPRAKFKLHLRPGASEMPWAGALRARFGPSVGGDVLGELSIAMLLTSLETTTNKSY